MTPHPVDHLLIALLLVGVPLAAARNYRGFVERARSGVPGSRAREYRKTIWRQWSVVAVIAVWWHLAGRPLVPTMPSAGRLAAGALLTVMVLAVLFMQLRAIRRMRGEQLAPLRAQVESVKDLVPHTEAEHATFRWLAVTAGICEELIFRAYLLWYLTPFTGIWLAVVVGGVAFGLAHAYQGKSGMGKTGLVGLLAGAFYAWSGSLLWPIIVHAGIDLQGGALSFFLARASPDDAPGPAPASANA
jgi:membrane protease YdiL (CAAX protease family)